MTNDAVGGYRLTNGAQKEAQVRGVSIREIHNILTCTVHEEPAHNVVTDGRNTAFVSPWDGLIASVVRGSRKKPA